MTLQQNRAFYKAFSINYVVFFISLLAAILIGALTYEPGYELLFLLPIVYSVCFLFVLSPVLIREFRIFFIVFIFITFGRYVLLPLMISVSGYYGGRSSLYPDSYSFTLALLLMMYELVIACIFIKFMESRYTINKIYFLKQIIVFKENNNTFYWIFSLIMLGFAFINSHIFKSINFLAPSKNVIRTFDDMTLVETITIYGLVVAKQLLFTVICFRLYKKYSINKKYRYILLVGLVSLLNISIYFGTNRSDVIIVGVVTVLLLTHLFGKRIRGLLIVLISTLAILIISISAIRGSVSITKNTNQLIDMTDTLQAYLGGPYNVSIAIETKSMYPEAAHPEVLFFDIFRPMIGVNFLVKDLDINYSNIYFNKRMWMDVDRRSQILPMVGQGNLFFGWLLSPVFTVLFIAFSYYLYSRIKKSQRIEMYYFLTLCLTRLGFMMGQNTMNMINDISMNLVLFLGVYFINNLLVPHKKNI